MTPAYDYYDHDDWFLQTFFTFFFTMKVIVKNNFFFTITVTVKKKFFFLFTMKVTVKKFFFYNKSYYKKNFFDPKSDPIFSIFFLTRRFINPPPQIWPKKWRNSWHCKKRSFLSIFHLFWSNFQCFHFYKFEVIIWGDIWKHLECFFGSWDDFSGNFLSKNV